MATIEQDLAQIRNAVYGRDVREAIADGLEQCYEDSTANAQIARIVEKGQETYDSIPADYSALTNVVTDLESMLSDYSKPINGTNVNGYIGSSTGVFKTSDTNGTSIFPVTSGKTYGVYSKGNRLVIAFGNSSTLSNDDQLNDVLNYNDTYSQRHIIEYTKPYSYMYVSSYANRDGGLPVLEEVILTQNIVDNSIMKRTSEYADLNKCQIELNKGINPTSGDIDSSGFTNYAATRGFIPVKAGTTIKKGILYVAVAYYTLPIVSAYVNRTGVNNDEYTILNDGYIRLTIRKADSSFAVTESEVLENVGVVYKFSLGERQNNLTDILSIDAVIPNSYINVSGMRVSSSRYCLTQRIPVKPMQDYYFILEHNGDRETSCTIFAYDADGEYVTTGDNNPNDEHNYKYFRLDGLSTSELTIARIFRFASIIKEICITYDQDCTESIKLLTYAEYDALTNQMMQKNKTEVENLSAKCWLTERSNQTYVREIISVANSYYNRKDSDGNFILHYNQSGTVLDNEYDGNGSIDCSCFIGLVLRGIPFEETEYNRSSSTIGSTGIIVDTDSDNGSNPVFTNYDYDANPEYDWSMNPYWYELQYWLHSTLITKVRTAAQIGELMTRLGRTVWIDSHLANVLPGDIVFFARKNRTSDDWIQNRRFMKISHVAIVIDKEKAPDDAIWDTTAYPYKHTICEVSGTYEAIGACGYRILEEYNGLYENGVSTLVLVCRPDLGRIAPTEL